MCAYKTGGLWVRQTVKLRFNTFTMLNTADYVSYVQHSTETDECQQKNAQVVVRTTASTACTGRFDYFR